MALLVKYTPKEPLPRPRKGRITEESRRKMRKAGKIPKPDSQGKAIRANWQRMFIAKHPLRPGEVYLRFRHPRLKHRTIEQVIVIASDAHRVEYSRDGKNWKIAKKVNPHAKD